jgi:CheY-like chemotaxis protein
MEHPDGWTARGDMTEMLGRIIGEDVDVTFDTPPGLPAVFLDPAQLEQAVFNLAVNARDAMPDGGTVAFRTRLESLGPADGRTDGEVRDYVVLEVSDTGIGMDDETLGRIFEPFFTTKDRGKGTGLGLAMVYGFVQQSGGTISVKSEPGVGTILRLRFPARVGEPLARRAQGSVAPHVVSQHDARILVVEDDDAVRSLVRKLLTRAGFVVEDVASAEAALAFLDQRTDIDLLMTDLVLPGASGRSLVEELRESRPDLRVLVTSGYADDSPGHPGDLASDIPFIQKPFSSGALIAAIESALGHPPRS